MVALGVQIRFKRGSDKPLEGEPIPNPPGRETPEETIESGVAPREISWICHPARERPLVAVLVALFLVGLVVMVQLGWKEWYITAFAALILWVSVAPFFLPTRFESDEKRVVIRSFSSRRGKEKPWSRFRRAAADRRGVLLSPFDRRSRLDRIHGMNLRYDDRDRERVLAHIESRVPVDRADDT